MIKITVISLDRKCLNTGFSLSLKLKDSKWALTRHIPQFKACVFFLKLPVSQRVCQKEKKICRHISRKEKEVLKL